MCVDTLSGVAVTTGQDTLIESEGFAAKTDTCGAQRGHLSKDSVLIDERGTGHTLSADSAIIKRKS